MFSQFSVWLPVSGDESTYWSTWNNTAQQNMEATVIEPPVNLAPSTSQVRSPPTPQLAPQPAPSRSQQPTPPGIGQFVYDRYFQKVSLRDFLHSKQLLQCAGERNITPAHLWREFMVHITENNIENTLAHLIEYLSLSPEKLEKEENMYKQPLQMYKIPYSEEVNTSKQINWAEYNRRTFPLKGYTHEDFLKLKKAAEDEFERKLIERGELMPQGQRELHDALEAVRSNNKYE